MSVKRRRQSWDVGDVFIVQTQDGKNVVGQIVGQERDVLNCVSCAFFDFRVKTEHELTDAHELPIDRIFSVLFVSRDLLDSGAWRVVKPLPVKVPTQWLPFEHLPRDEWIGAEVRGSAIVNEFLNAFFGLVPWDDWHDPAYLDGLLLSADKKPRRLIYKKRA